MSSVQMNQLIKPMHDRVLIERDVEKTTAGGIVLAEQAQELQRSGVILELGADWHPFQVKVGDRVYFGAYAGIEINHEGKPYLLLKESEILAVEE